MDLLDRVEGALLGTVIGDALGRPFEGTPTSDLARLRRAVERRVEAPRGWGYSDDAEMMLAVADSIATRRDVDEAHLLETMAASHDPARGYGKGTRRAFRVWRETGDWRLASRACWAEGSRGNGAAVRVAPIAIVHGDLERLRVAARRSASPTHAHPEAMAGAELVAVAIRCGLDGRPVPLPTTGTALDARVSSIDADWSRAEAVAALGNGVLAIESALLAMWAHAGADSFEAAVIEAVSGAGDTDSIGAMTGALAGSTYGARAIPQSWVDALEPPVVTRVRALSAALLAITAR